MPNLNQNQQKAVQYVGLHERLKKLSKWAETNLRDPLKTWLHDQPEMSVEIPGYGKVFLSTPSDVTTIEHARIKNDLVMALRNHRISLEDLILQIEQGVLAAVKPAEMAAMLSTRLNANAEHYIHTDPPAEDAARSLQLGFTAEGKARARAELRGLSAMERAAGTNRRSRAATPRAGRRTARR